MNILIHQLGWKALHKLPNMPCKSPTTKGRSTLSTKWLQNQHLPRVKNEADIQKKCSKGLPQA